MAWNRLSVIWMGQEHVLVDDWEDDVPGTKLEPSRAEFLVASWLRDPSVGPRIRALVMPSANVTEQAITDAFRFGRFKVLAQPRPERKPVKLDDASSAAPYVAPAPAKAQDEPVEKHWFEVKLLDEFGEPIEDTDVVFSQAGRQETLTTDGDGVARWEEIEGPSFADVKIANVASLRETLKPRYEEARERKEPDEPDVTKVLLGTDDEPGRALTAEQQGVLVIGKSLMRLRLIGMHFDTNKCFLREPAMHGIRKVVSAYQQNPSGKLLILGHTDTTADDAYNLDLSVERAESIRAYLKDDVAAWEAWFGDGKPAQKRWGNREVTSMIKALPCEQTVAGFQAWSNEKRGTDLKVDGAAGPKTRKALIEAYMALDGTTLPKAIDAEVHGCGEFFPLGDEGDKGGADNVEAAENRRVEIYCFHDEIVPASPGRKATRGEPQYEAWKSQVTHTYDFETGITTEALVLEWPDWLGDGLPSDLEILVDYGKSFTKKWSEGTVNDGHRRFTFTDVADSGTCTLQAKSGDTTLLLWDAQDPTDPERPPTWQHVLEELFVMKDEPLPDGPEGQFPETEEIHGTDLR